MEEQIKITPEIQKVVKEASGRPCAMCGDPPDWVMAFIPKHHERFGIAPGLAIFAPLCAKCVSDRNADPEGFRDFLEEFLFHAGVKCEFGGRNEKRTDQTN